MIFLIVSELILSGIPTKPSSCLSGITLITLFILEFLEIAFAPYLFKELTISLLKSINTFSTILITFSSVTLKPFINFV